MAPFVSGLLVKCRRGRQRYSLSYNPPRCLPTILVDALEKSHLALASPALSAMSAISGRALPTASPSIKSGGNSSSDASESYGLYSRDVDWSAIPQKKGIKRFFRSAWALFQVMLMKLSPARRILMLHRRRIIFLPRVEIFLPHAKGEDAGNFYEFSAIALFIFSRSNSPIA